MYFDLDWLYDIFILEIWHLFSIVLSVFFLVYTCLNSRKTVLFYHYLVLQLILLNWLVSKVFKTVAPTVELKWVFIVAQYFTVAFLGSAVLLFSYLYTRGRTLPLGVSILLNIPPLVFFVLIATNASHHLFYSRYDFLGDTFGPVFYAYSAMTYLYIAVGLFWFAAWFRRRRRPGQFETRLLSAGIIIPLIVNVLYIGRLVKFRFDITPVSYNLSLILFAYAIYRYRFLDVVPLGISAAFNGLREGVLVTDTNGEISDYNQVLPGMPGLNGEVTREKVNYFMAGINPVVERETAAGAALPERAGLIREIRTDTGEDRHITVSFQPVAAGDDKAGCLYVFYDNTEYLKLIRELEEKNEELAQANFYLQQHTEELKRLAVMQERNRMAGEIHDILGHSLVLILNILESSLLLLATNPDKAEELVHQALISAGSAISELHNSGRTAGTISAVSVAMLKNELRQLADKYLPAGMKINLEIRGQRESIPVDHSRTVIRICREALNNALKHGAAEEADIFVRFNEKTLDVYVVDSGRGCPKHKKGNGLIVMEQRVRELNGVLSCGTPGGKGFVVHAGIPW